MRITIGGILVTGAVAAVAALGPWSPGHSVLQPVVNGMAELFKDDAGSSQKAAATPQRSVEDALPIAEVQSSSATENKSLPLKAESAAAPVLPASADPVKEKVAVPSAASDPLPEKTTSRRRRRSRRGRAQPASDKPAKTLSQVGHRTPAKQPAVKVSRGANADPLLGHYVAVKLKSGREVKGILDSKLPDGIMLTIPGMGPFKYPNSNIDAIKAAE